MINIINEFESRYKRDIGDVDMICKEIYELYGDKLGMTLEEIDDYIHIHRYEDNSSLTED
jgi:hypothetical protein